MKLLVTWIYIIGTIINLIGNMRMDVNPKTHPSTRTTISRKGLAPCVVVVVDDGTAKISRHAPDCGVTMTETAKHAPFARVRALATQAISKDRYYVILQTWWIVNITVAPVFFISYDAAGRANALFIARHRKMARTIE